MISLKEVEGVEWGGMRSLGIERGGVVGLAGWVLTGLGLGGEVWGEGFTNCWSLMRFLTSSGVLKAGQEFIY